MNSIPKKGMTFNILHLPNIPFVEDQFSSLLPHTRPEKTQGDSAQWISPQKWQHLTLHEEGARESAGCWFRGRVAWRVPIVVGSAC